MQSIIAELHNGHTHMLNKNFYIYDKNAVNSAPDGYKAWIKQFNNPKAVNRYSKMPNSKEKLNISANNITPNNVKTQIIDNGKIGYLSIHLFNIFNKQKDMKIIKPFLKTISHTKALIIDIRGNGGGSSPYWSDNIVPMLINKPLHYKSYMVFRGGKFTEAFLKSISGYGYEKLRPISDIYNNNLTKLPKDLKTDFKYYEECPLNIALHYSIGYKGRIYLLVDWKVFSSAEAFATFCKNTHFATIVGEKTGGDGIGFDPAFCTLPNSGYVFEFTQQMGLTADGSCNFENKTEPDIKVSAKKGLSYSDDAAVKTVLKLVNN